ncbi:thermonuclease family protein [Colwellia psychrerythraea]|uniref:Nuclease (SNase domain-containing protein) n=1 Tax=Colwellia psychrerythraea TaxID=28229 RepID=A0A099L711_COLPS|nr:thermonuclease family protein [Colwellia psychrerythraea]KGJ97663.1 nuclease (SNase domain-containing protein) [Colwellia psychrerythraea]
MNKSLLTLSFTLLLAALLAIQSFSISAKNNSYGNATVAEITSIYDGDTFRANIEGFPTIVGEHMSIRINGIDTPELRGKCPKEKAQAKLAKQFTVKHLRGAKRITLKNIKRGKYFRLIADVYVDGLNLAEQLIKYNHATEYHGKTKKNWCS